MGFKGRVHYSCYRIRIILLFREHGLGSPSGRDIKHVLVTVVCSNFELPRGIHVGTPPIS